MTNGDLEAIRALIREELAPIRATVDGLGTTVEGLGATVEAIRATVEAMRPNVDGIPLIRRAVGVLQDEVRGLREEVTVIAATTIRLDNTRERHEALLTEMLQEIRAMHTRHRGHETRIRRLEGHDD